MADSEVGTISPWNALDRFIKDMEKAQVDADPFATALSTICESTNARLAFISSESGSRTVSLSGPQHVSSKWCRDFAEGLATRSTRGGIWSLDGHDGAWDVPSDPLPHSAVILPIPGPPAHWLVAVSFHPDRPLGELDSRIIKIILRLQLGHNRNLRVHENLKDTLFGIIRCLSTAIDAKDAYTCGHSERVARIAVRLGEEMGLSRGEVSDLYLAGLLHDVGKIGIRDEVLCKPSALTPEERKHMEEHPVIGEQIIANVTRLAYLRPAVRGHHERIDGRGYPDGLAGEAIPFSARIIAVADTCDAMMSQRRYRPALAPARIESIFREGAGSQWDASIVDSFFSCRHELYPVFQRGLGQSVYMAVERAATGDPRLLGTPVNNPLAPLQ
jgi:HD-GYP domain-containing protein (c-di-GMP phosphodiesterase class II)